MLPEIIESMSQSEAVSLLIELRAEIEEASEALDWALVARLNTEIGDIAERFPKEDRSPLIAQAMAEMKACYERIFADSKVRKKELRGELGKLREKRGALEGYKNSLAAGNRELRTNA